MRLNIKRVDKSLPMPQYQTSGSVAFDLYAREDVEIAPFTPTIVPSNLIIKVPKGYFLLIASRSSLPIKKGLMLANGIGVIDQDYHGDTDEIGVLLFNFTKNKIIVKRGERIAQAILVKIAKVESFAERESFSKLSRGGFGSTG